jgi:hypothetical protein
MVETAQDRRTRELFDQWKQAPAADKEALRQQLAATIDADTQQILGIDIAGGIIPPMLVIETGPVTLTAEGRRLLGIAEPEH